MAGCSDGHSLGSQESKITTSGACLGGQADGPPWSTSRSPSEPSDERASSVNGSGVSAIHNTRNGRSRGIRAQTTSSSGIRSPGTEARSESTRWLCGSASTGISSFSRPPGSSESLRTRTSFPSRRISSSASTGSGAVEWTWTKASNRAC